MEDGDTSSEDVEPREIYLPDSVAALLSPSASIRSSTTGEVKVSLDKINHAVRELVSLCGSTNAGVSELKDLLNGRLTLEMKKEENGRGEGGRLPEEKGKRNHRESRTKPRVDHGIGDMNSPAFTIQTATSGSQRKGSTPSSRKSARAADLFRELQSIHESLEDIVQLVGDKENLRRVKQSRSGAALPTSRPPPRTVKGSSSPSVRALHRVLSPSLLGTMSEGQLAALLDNLTQLLPVALASARPARPEKGKESPKEVPQQATVVVHPPTRVHEYPATAERSATDLLATLRGKREQPQTERGAYLPTYNHPALCTPSSPQRQPRTCHPSTSTNTQHWQRSSPPPHRHSALDAIKGRQRSGSADCPAPLPRSPPQLSSPKGVRIIENETRARKAERNSPQYKRACTSVQSVQTNIDCQVDDRQCDSPARCSITTVSSFSRYETALNNKRVYNPEDYRRA